MLSIRNQIICLSIAMLLMICFQPDQVNGQIKKKKLLKGLMGASLLKLLKPKKGGVLPLPFPLPLPLPIDWHTQAGLLSKNNAPTHVSHQPYPQSAIQTMSPIEYSEYQNAITQALSNSYIPSYPSTGSTSYSSGGSSSVYPSSGQNENSDGYNSNSGSVSNSYSDAGSSSGPNNYGSSSGSNNNYDSSSGSNNNYDASSNYGSNSGPASYGVAGVGQNDEYNAYQVSNDNGQSGGYRAAASSINPEYNSFQRNPDISEMMMNAQNKNQVYGRNYDAIQQGSSMTARLRDQLMAFADKERNKVNLQDNNGAASSNSFISTSSQQNNYIPLRSVPMYHHVTDNQQSNYQPLSNVPQKSFTSNGFSSSSSNGWQPID